ncbi:MAG: CDP-alcohol phosphatidyltransferase family protein [Candidatus Saccharimonadales bacterium]
MIPGQDAIMTVKMIAVTRRTIRRAMHRIAMLLNQATGGRLSPNSVTIVGVLMHIPIAILIATGWYWQAAILLVIFGLFDTLDGELARLQNRASTQGMLLDASTDRMKEVMLYTGVAYVFATGSHPATAAWAVLACGASLCVSYVKAKGEAAIASSPNHQKIPHATLNRMFADGLLPFELRMVLLLIGLLGHVLLPVIVIIAVLASFTAVQRLVTISAQLSA